MGSFTSGQPLAGLKVAVLGAGKMGGILLQAFLKSKVLEADQLVATVGHEERAAQLSAQWGVDVSTDNVAAAAAADLILIGVKPIQVPDLIQQIRPSLTPKKLLISIAASVRTTAIEQAAGMDIGVVRAMPNTPSMLGAGIAALNRGRFATQEQLDLAEFLFTTIGRTGYRNLAGRADDLRRGQDGAGNGVPSGVAEGRGHHPGGLHHRRHSGTGRRGPARYADQSGHACHAARQGTGRIR
jgi:hypothetical protein